VGPEVIRKVKVMFRKMAIALVAASVFAAPVLAQGTLSGAASPSKSPESTPVAPSGETADKAANPEKAEKSAATTEKATKATKATKTVTRHHRVVSHHRRGTKTAKYVKSHTKTAMYGKHPSAKSAKYATVESRRIGHGKSLSKPALGTEVAKSGKIPRHNIGRAYNRTTSMHVYGKASKRMPSKSMTKPGTKPNVD
jgi:hypothetical protein